MIVSKTERATDWLIYLFMALVCIVMVYPFLYVLAYSLSDSQAAMRHTITILPINPTLEHFRVILTNHTVYDAFIVSVARVVVGVLYALTVTGLASYAISKPSLPGRTFFTFILMIPMFVSGGLLPSYIWTYKLHLFNSFWVYILPIGFSAFHMLIMRTFFQGIPAELDESAKIDGAGAFTIFWRIVLPLSKPVLATIALFVGVAQWNAWFDALLYITKEGLMPLQFILQKMLNESLATQIMAQEGRIQSLNAATVSPESIKMSTLIVATVPITLVYPFLQRYFMKGVMIGAVKG